MSSIWAEADKGYDYGIYVKCSLPYAPIIQFFIEVCGFSKLLDFVENKISLNNMIFEKYINDMRERIKLYKCGEIRTLFKGIICGYFKTSEHTIIEKGKRLPYLGEVREERYILPLDQLKWTLKDWEIFLKENNLM